MSGARYISLELDGHRNIYLSGLAKENEMPRKLRTEIVLPEKGADENTGVLILISAYGGNIDSHVFKKMREEFSDLYNMAVVQCDYWGSKYMGGELLTELQVLWEFPYKLSGTLRYFRDTGESETEFNDMGIMQSLDIVNATLSAIYDLRRRQIPVNTQKIILFGPSHGAYLGYCANLICPGLYKALIDISGYLKPHYLENKRSTWNRRGELYIEVFFEYFLARHPEYRYHEDLYDLHFLYKYRENTCKVIAFQGKEDWMVDWREKETFIHSLNNAEFLLIGADEVDGILCGSADHGLEMDFFELFKMIMPMLDPILRGGGNSIELQKEVVLGDEHAFMRISYESGLPRLEEITFE